MFGISLFLVGTISALILTPTQLSTVTDNQIKDYLLNNITYEGYKIDHDDKKVYFHYTTISIEPHIENGIPKHYFTKRVKFKQSIDFWVIQKCISDFSSKICWNDLVENFNTINTGVPNPTSGNDIIIEPVYLQFEKQLTKEYNQIKKLRDSYRDKDIDKFITEAPGNVPNPVI